MSQPKYGVYDYLTLAVILINPLLHLAVAGNLEQHRDELLYFALGRYPAFGYPSVPPLTPWIAGVVDGVVGSSVLAVKLLPALAAGQLTWIATKISEELGGGGYARFLTALAILVMPVTLRVFYLFQPVYLDLIFWSLLTLFALRYTNSGEGKYLLFLGGCAGAALMNKYLVGVYLVGLLVGLAFSPYRRVFGERAFYLALLLALFVCSPNLTWQVAQGFPVFGHIGALNDSQLVHVDRVDFLVQQLLMAFAAAWLLVGGLVWLLRQRRFRYLGIAALVSFAVLILLRGKAYYTLGLFPGLVAGGAVWWEQLVRQRWMKVTVPAVMFLLTAAILPLGIPVFGPEGLRDYFVAVEERSGSTAGRASESGRVMALPQDYADAIGWRELARECLAAYRQEAEPQAAVIYCENYGQAAALLLLTGDELPEPISFSDGFNYWVPRSFMHPVTVFYYVNDELGEDIRDLFADIRVVGRIDDPLAREYGTTIYRCASPRRPFADFWSEVLARDPSPF